MSTPQTTSPPATSQRKQWQKFFFFFTLLLVMTGVAYWWGNRTYHFAAVDDGVLYRDGNRGMTEFASAVRKSHAKTVISLIDDEELNDANKPQFKKEADFLARVNARQERIPVKLGGWPSGDDVKRFLAIVADPTNRPVLVHCAQGVRRTGMFVAAYQESALHYDKAKAKDAVQSFGHSERTVEDVKTFIDNYDPAAMSVATTMPAGSE
jgi:protein tyrosine phosphatase (PTP) superfamily phosphohydrolase (DUF442 family)